MQKTIRKMHSPGTIVFDVVNPPEQFHFKEYPDEIAQHLGEIKYRVMVGYLLITKAKNFESIAGADKPGENDGHAKRVFRGKEDGGEKDECDYLWKTPKDLIEIFKKRFSEKPFLLPNNEQVVK